MSLLITEAARLLGVSTDLLRIWDEGGLLVADRVGSRRDRRYDRDVIENIEVVKRGKKLLPVQKVKKEAS